MGKDQRLREYLVPVRVEFEDVDGYRIAHHTRLVAFLERARVRFFREIGLEVFAVGAVPVLARLDIRFKRPALFGDELEVALTVREVTDFQLVLGYRVRRDTETLATATTKLAFSHAEQGELMPLPDDFQAALKRWRGGAG
jgi:acyl-CoA thioester hydrolase